MSTTVPPTANGAQTIEPPADGTASSAVPPTDAPASSAPPADPPTDAPASSAPGAEPPISVSKQPMGPKQRGAIGAALVLTSILLMTQLIAIWSAVAHATSTAPGPRPPMPQSALLFGLAHETFTTDVVLIVMVVMGGALGAMVGATRRFLYFAGRDELTRRDEWSYLMRPMQGAVLALIVYFTLRGGYLGQDQTAPVNPYGVAALSALVGLFTGHAVSKLTDVFDTMFGKPREETNPVKVD